MNNTFRDCKSMVNITGLLDDLGTNKQYCKLSQITFVFQMTFVFCHMSKCFYFSTRVSLWKRVHKMPKSGTGHADAIGFRGHIHVMQWNNSSLQLGNKMAKLSNIDSYHETLIHIVNHGFACSICAQIIQRILWCYNGFCDFHWNHIQRILCFSGAIRLSAGDHQRLNTNLVTELVRTREWEILLRKIFKNFNQFTFVNFSVFLIYYCAF